MNTNQRPYAFVSGASKGLGRELAIELGKHEYNLLLLSLPGEGLEGFADELRAKGLTVKCLEKDLSKEENLDACIEWVNQFPLTVLINNVGVGGNNHFLDADRCYLTSIIDLNIKATTILTHELLPNLLKREQAYVLNVSSLAAYSPIAYKTIYPASKAFVHSFTRSLQKEFKGRNVSFSVVNPGPMKTNGHVTDRIESQGFWVKLTVLTAKKVAAYCIKGMFAKKEVIFLNWVHRLGWLLLMTYPLSLKRHILSGKTKNEVREL